MKDYASDKFVGGMAFNYAAKNNGVALEIENGRFDKFTQEDYDAVFAKLKSGEIELKKDTGAGSAAELAGDWVTIVLDRTGNQPGKSVLLLHQQGRSDPLHLERTDGAGDHRDPGNSRGNQR